MKLKIRTIGNIFGKICLKAIRDEKKRRHEGKGEDSIFWWRGSESSLVLPLDANPGHS